MNLTCFQCGNPFTITAEQLGTRGKCPHCKATIILPKAVAKNQKHSELVTPSLWMERWFSILGAAFLHVLVLVLLALIPYRYLSVGETTEGSEVVIGQMNRYTLTDTAESEFQDELANAENTAQALDSFSDDMLSPTLSDLSANAEFDVQLVSPSTGKEGDFDIRAIQKMNEEAFGDQEFDQLVSRLKQDGLEIVITFDSTGSMEGEIQEVKNKIERMGAVLFRMIPKTRISVCTYRDTGAKYVVKGVHLTDNLGDIVNFLEDVSAAGGGDDPEAVNAALEWSIKENSFRPRARKIILLFGDAPPHAADKDYCLRLASEFRRKYHGIVSTVTCHSQRRIPAFIEIAQMGGGEAFLTRDEREIMTQLIVLVFGSKYREKVLEAFSILGR